MEEENENVVETGPTPVEIQQYLSGIEYPATKEDLIEHAQSTEATENVLALLATLPEREYASPADVSKAIGEMV